MNKSLLAITAVFILVLPTIASAALELELYTNGGYDALNTALTNLVLIFSDNGYKAVYGMAFIIGITFGGAAVYAKIISGANVHPLSFVPPIIVGVCIWTVFIVPKGKLHIWDTVYNKDVTVANVPDGIVLLAGGLNIFERKAIDLVDTAAGVAVNAKLAGGVGWLGLYNASKNTFASGDPSLDANLKRYVADCVSFELTLPASTLTIKELRGTDPGATQYDYITTLGKAANPAIDTLIYTSTDSMGTVTNCKAAWEDADIGLKKSLNSLDTYNGMDKMAKMETGYGITGFTLGGGGGAGTDPWSNTIVDTLGLSGLDTTKVTSSRHLIRQLYISHVMDTALKEGDAARITNYQFMQNASGSMVAANEWLPYLRAGLMAVTIGMIPFLALFIPTPLSGRAVSLICGLFIWNTVWGVADVVIQSFGTQFAEKVFASVAAGSLGMDGLYFMPGQSIKMLSIFGMLRMSGMALATIISGMLVKFGGSAMAHMAGGISGNMQSTGAAGAATTLNPAGGASAIKANTDAFPTMAHANAFEFGQRSAASAGSMFSNTASTLSGMTEAGGFGSYVQSNATHGGLEQHKKMGGNTAGTQAQLLGKAMGMDQTQIDRIANDHHNSASFLTTMQRLQTQANGLGMSGNAAADMYFGGKKQDSMTSNSIAGKQGFNLSYSSTPDGKGVFGVKSAGAGPSGVMDATTGNFTTLTGMSSGVNTSSMQQEAWSNKIAESRQQTAAYAQQVGSQILQSLSNSSTRSSLDSQANKSSVVKAGMHAATKAAERAITNSLKNATSITDSAGHTIKKGAEGWSSAVLQAKAGMEAFGNGATVSTDIGGKMTVGISTSQDSSMSVNFGEEESRAISQKAGEAWSDSTTKSKGVEKSATDSKAVAEAQTITGTKNAQESLTASEQRTNAYEQARTSQYAESAESRSNLDAAFVNHVGNRMFSGGVDGNLKAANYLNELGSMGSNGQDQLKGLMSDFMGQDNVAPSGGKLPDVQGPGENSVPDYDGARKEIKIGADNLVSVQGGAEKPHDVPKSLREQIRAFNPSNNNGGFNLEAEKRNLAVNKDNLGVAWKERNSINSDPMSHAEIALGQKTAPNAADVSRGYVYQNPSLTEGLGDQTGKVLSYVSGRELGKHIDGKLDQAVKELSLLGSGLLTVAIQDKPLTMAHIEPLPAGTSKPGSLTLLGGN